MKAKRTTASAGAITLALIGLGGLGLVDAPAVAPIQAPRFEVDPLWPKPFPNHWILGSATGVVVDARDHIYVVHLTDTFAARTESGLAQNPPSAECCRPAPNVLELDASGSLVSSWGGNGAGYQWPTANSGVSIGAKGNVWIGGGGNDDHVLLEFGRDGKFVRQLGSAGTYVAPPKADTSYASPAGRGGPARVGGGVSERSGCGSTGGPPGAANSANMDGFFGANQVAVDEKANEGYVADGCRNHRIAVIDLASGAIKRVFGAYGNKPDDTPTTYTAGSSPKQFSTVTCAELASDGLLYVCDRGNDRVQVFRKDGSFVKEKVLAPSTLGDGSVWDVAFSRDPQQKYLYVADGMNARIYVLDRQSLEVITSFGTGGRQPGQFLGVSGIATDSKGNLYTVEAFEGKRVQKFTFKGVGPVSGTDQGTLWPRSDR